MNLSFKETQFIIEAIDNLIDNYQERIEAIQDMDEDETADLGNDCMFLECLRQDLAKSVEHETSSSTLEAEDNKKELEECREFVSVSDLSWENIIESLLKLSLNERLVILNIVTDSIREDISELESPDLPKKKVAFPGLTG